jgi:hypothetical protein
MIIGDQNSGLLYSCKSKNRSASWENGICPRVGTSVIETMRRDIRGSFKYKDRYVTWSYTLEYLTPNWLHGINDSHVCEYLSTSYSSHVTHKSAQYFALKYCLGYFAITNFLWKGFSISGRQFDCRVSRYAI